MYAATEGKHETGAQISNWGAGHHLPHTGDGPGLV